MIWMGVLVYAAVIAAALYFLYLIRDTGLGFYWHGWPLSFRKCRLCGGLGAVLLEVSRHGHKKYLIIPPEMRSQNLDTADFMPPNGNVVRCPRCHGIGKIWGLKQIV